MILLLLLLNIVIMMIVIVILILIMIIMMIMARLQEALDSGLRKDKDMIQQARGYYTILYTRY